MAASGECLIAFPCHSSSPSFTTYLGPEPMTVALRSRQACSARPPSLSSSGFRSLFYLAPSFCNGYRNIMGQTKILGTELTESSLWSDHVSISARWLFICLLLKTDDEGKIFIDEDFRVCSEISGIGIQSSELALSELERAKLITVFNNGSLVIHNVNELRVRQTEKQVKANERVRRYRERNRNANRNGHPPQTPPLDSVSTSTVSTSSTSTVQDKKPKKTDAEIKQETGFNEFWDAYGKKTGTKRAFSAWKRLTKRQRIAAMAGVKDYVRSTPDVRFRKNPTTWINQRCWEDEMISPVKPRARKVIPEAGEIDF